MPEPLKVTADVYYCHGYVYVQSHGEEVAAKLPTPMCEWLAGSTFARPIAGNPPGAPRRYEVTADVELEHDQMFLHIGTAIRIFTIDLALAQRLVARQARENRTIESRRVEESAAIAGVAVQEEMFV